MREVNFLYDRNLPDSDWKLPLSLTIAVHAITLILAIGGPLIFKKTPHIPEVYTVNLFNASELPSPPLKVPVKEPRETKKIIQSKTVAPPPVAPPKEAVSLKPLKERLQKEKEQKEKEMILSRQLDYLKSKLRQEELHQEAKRSAQEAVDKLSEFYQKDTLKQTTKASQEPEETSDPNQETGNAAGAAFEMEALARYKASLFQHIHKHWSLPDLQDWEESLEAVMVVRVRRNGTVINSYFDKRSEDFNFNREVEKAIKKSSPFPPFPPEIKTAEEELVITFFPGGLL